MSITINGQTSPATEFAWDGCHKIYLLDNGDADKNGKYGYMLSKNGEAGYKVLPVSELQRVWDQSCPLRFLTLPWLKPRDSCELGLLGFRRYA